MNKEIAFPFLTLPDEAVRAGPWHVSINNRAETALGEYIEGWDYNAGLSVRRQVGLDLGRAAEVLRIRPDEFRPGLVVSVGTGGSAVLPALIVASRTWPYSPDSAPIDVEIQLDGAHLSRVLYLFTDVILLAAPRAGSVLSPKNVGDRVWSDRHRAWLEGDRPRFPIEEASLEDEYAPWRLLWSPGDWCRDFHGALRLCLNSRRPDVVEKVKAKDRFTLQAMLADSISQLVEGFLSEDDPDAIASDCPEGSLADQVERWIRDLFPHGGVGAARQMLNVDPGRLRQMIWSLSYLPEE